MSATRAQQVGIWIIAIVLTAGTIGSFVAIVLANENQKTVESDYESQMAEYQKQMEEQAKANAANSEPLDGYKAEKFENPGDELVVEVLKEGSGDVVQKTDTITASYFGWLEDGTIFDSSNKKDADDAPVSFPLSGVIKGWTDGLTGQKVGSVVKLTIPADQGYGSAGSGVIPADAPLQFIVIINKIGAETTE